MYREKIGVDGFAGNWDKAENLYLNKRFPVESSLEFSARVRVVKYGD